MIRVLLALVCFFSFLSADELYLKNNLRMTRPGDYIVAIQGKSVTLLHIFERQGNLITIEEVAIPSARAKQYVSSWREWLEQGACGNTSWVIYQIDLNSGNMLRYFSFTKNGWFHIPQAENFLGTLLNLNLTQIPYEKRRKLGHRGGLWQPQMVVESEVIPGVFFEAYNTVWPKDGTPLSGKAVEVYIPRDERFPSYFPYWLQISGGIGKANFRIIDSGSNLHSPRAGFPVVEAGY